MKNLTKVAIGLVLMLVMVIIYLFNAPHRVDRLKQHYMAKKETLVDKKAEIKKIKDRIILNMFLNYNNPQLIEDDMLKLIEISKTTDLLDEFNLTAGLIDFFIPINMEHAKSFIEKAKVRFKNSKRYNELLELEHPKFEESDGTVEYDMDSLSDEEQENIFREELFGESNQSQ